MQLICYNDTLLYSKLNQCGLFIVKEDNYVDKNI